jgi:uncharacterized protein YcbX
LLDAGRTVEFDRCWAIENGRSQFDSNNPKHLPKTNFLMLMRHERLAALDVCLDPADTTLTIRRDGRQVVKGQLTTPIGRQLIEQFIAGYMQGELKGPPRIVSAKNHSFSDVAEKCVHIVNLASLRELERVVGRHLDPLRFRANIYIYVQPAWVEFDWIGKELAAGDARINVFKRTERCAATNVNPETAKRDTAIPQALLQAYGHSDFGVYAKVIAGGMLKDGDNICLV